MSERIDICELCGTNFPKNEPMPEYWFECGVCGSAYKEYKGKWYHEDSYRLAMIIKEDDEN